MKINKQEFLNALTSVQPGIGKNESIDQVTYIHLMDDMIVTYNHEIMVSIPLKTSLCGSVHAKEIYEIVKKINDKELEVSQTKSNMTIESGNLKVKLKYQDEVKVDLLEYDIESTSVKPLCENFLPLMKCVLDTACISPTMKVTRDVIHICDNVMEATDLIRITKCIMNKPIRRNFLIPNKAAKELIKYDVDSISFENQGWIKLYNISSGIMIAIRIIEIMDEDDYVDIDSILKQETTFIEQFKIPKKEMTSLLERIKVFANTPYEPDQSVEITLGGEYLKVSSSSQFGSIEETVEIESTLLLEGEKEEYVFYVNPNFLNALRYSDTQCTIINHNRLQFQFMYQGCSVIHCIQLKRK